MNRNIEIYEAYKAGKSNVKLAREYGISQARVSQIIRDKVDQLETRPARRLVSRDQSIAMFGTWADKVCLLVHPSTSHTSNSRGEEHMTRTKNTHVVVRFYRRCHDHDCR
jgi:hypothetical protein